MPFKKPTLASAAPAELADFPYIASPKIDGVRASVQGGVLVSRTGKPIPNAQVQAALRAQKSPEIFEGLDGELTFGPPNAPNTMQATTSVVMSKNKDATGFQFHLFDNMQHVAPFEERLAGLLLMENNQQVPDFATVVAHQFIENNEQLELYEKACLDAGYEGVMLRKPDSPYKHGRSTAKEGYLLKVKRFSDGEAKVLGFKELYHNENEKVDGERSTCKEGLRAGDTLGALAVQDILTGVEFDIGTGFTQQERLYIWHNQDQFEGKLVHYRHFAVAGVKDKPRFPAFVCFRSEDDL